MHEQTTNKETNRTRRQSLFWTMVILFVLDLLFLLWTFNPLAGFGRFFTGTSGGEQTFAAAESEPVDRQKNAAKLSPLGRAAGLDLKQPIQADASRRHQIIPAYRRRLPDRPPPVGMDGTVTSTKGPS
jgi:hypothetical protein